MAGRQGNSQAAPNGVAGATLADQIRENVVDGNTAAASAIIDRALEDQELLLKARQLVNYGDAVVSVADGSVSERFGSKSVPMLEIVVPIALLGIKIQGTIWARLTNKTDGTEVKMEASVGKGIKYIDSTGKDRLLAHMENAAQAWPGYAKAEQTAIAALMGTKATTAGYAPRPTLVRKLVATAAQPASAPAATPAA